MNTFRRVNRWIPSRCVPLFLAFFLFFCACPATPLEQEAVAATLTVNTLADNGGPTRTLALKPGSPAINGVVYGAPNGCPAKDQRGIERPPEAVCDIGAIEFFWRYAYLPLIQN